MVPHGETWLGPATQALASRGQLRPGLVWLGVVRHGVWAALLTSAALALTTMGASAQSTGNDTVVTRTTTPLTNLAPITNFCAPQDGPISLSGTQTLVERLMPNGQTLGDLRDMLTGTSANGTRYLEIVHETTPVPITLVDYMRTELLISQGPSANQRTVNTGHGNVVTCFGDDTATI